MSRAKTIIARAFAMSVVCLPAAGCTHAPATINVNEMERHQKIEGWEVTARAWEFDKVNDRFDGSVVAQKEQLATMLADDIGIDRIRLEIKSGMENPTDYWSSFASGRMTYGDYRRHFYDKINDNADAFTLDPARIQFSDLDWHVETFVLPLKQKVEARRRRFHLNLAYVDFKWTDIKGSLSHAKNPAEYAELIAATFAHLRDKYGLKPDSLEIVIEPDNTDDWSGVAIGHAIVAARARLNEEGFTGVEIIAPSTAKGQRALDYLDDLKKVPGALNALSTISYHRYDGEPSSSDLNDLARTAGKTGKRTAMLEYVDADITDLIADLSDGSATAWQQYGIAARVGDDRPLKPGWLMLASGGLAPKLTMSAIARHLSAVFTNVDAGSIRVGTSSDSRDVASVAFTTPRQKLVVVIHSQSTLPLTVKGLRRGSYGLSAIDDAGRPLASQVITTQGQFNLNVVGGATYVVAEN